MQMETSRYQEANNGKSRFLRVRVRLVGGDLEVNDSKLDDLASFDLLDENWRTVWESDGQLEGPTYRSALACSLPVNHSTSATQPSAGRR